MPRDHPAAQGHFAGDPIMPGAVLLSEALCAIGASLGIDVSLCRVRSAKFFHPARPGDRILIEFSCDEDRRLSFACRVGERTVLAAEVQCKRGAA